MYREWVIGVILDVKVLFFLVFIFHGDFLQRFSVNSEIILDLPWGILNLLFLWQT
jgi:TRAP-type uncharacterized transport system fused permease subunit